MIEIWELAISPNMLPFTLLLVPVALYWVFCMLGMLDLDFLDIDFGLDGDGGVDAEGGHSQGGGVFHGALKFMNATDVPLMAVLSFLCIFLWGSAMLANFLLNPDGSPTIGSIIAVLSLFPAVLFTKWLTAPMKPLFRSLKGSEGESKPVIGRAGRVRSRMIDDKTGQVEVEDSEVPLLINARLAAGSDALEKGTQVLVYQHDADSGVYLVRSLTDPTN